MLRPLSIALFVLGLAPAAMAEDSQCVVTYENNSGTDFKGQASLWKGDTLQVGDTTYTDANGGTFNFTLDNDSTLVIQAVESKECDIVTVISDMTNAVLKSEVKATGSQGSAKCDEGDQNFNKYGCTCQHDKGAHHARITMSCDGDS